MLVAWRCASRTVEAPPAASRGSYDAGDEPFYRDRPLVIVAIEGTSAAGKTTWCRTHAPGLSVPEEPSSRKRWQMALAVEREHGLAVCDTDPAKLYYAYALWRSRRLDDAGWLASCAQTREAFAAGELGLTDLTCFAERDLGALERHRADDASRRRHRFDLHVELQPLFREWWEAVDAIEPGRVLWAYPTDITEFHNHAPRHRRVGAELLDAVLAKLPSSPLLGV